MSDEKRLIQRIKQGDRQAFTQLLDTYGAQIHRLVRRYITNPTDAEDITQEVFLEIYRSIGGFRGESALTTWIYRIAVNRCLRYCQRERHNDLAYDEQVLKAESNNNGHLNDPLRSAACSELKDKVYGALDKLSEGHRDVVILCELHGMTYQECANVLEIPLGTVKSRLSNAFKHLRGSLRSYVFGELALSETTITMEKMR